MSSQTFVFQIHSGDMMADYVCGARESLREFRWLHPKEAESINEILVHDVHNPAELPNEYLRDGLLVPVGSIEFCENLLRRWYGLPWVAPINIPAQLMAPQYTGRKVSYCTSLPAWKNFVRENAGLNSRRLFVKRADRAKAEPTFVFPDERAVPLSFAKGQVYLVSEWVDIKSEWRAFVWKEQILDIRCYSGDFWAFPDRKSVERMVATYTDNPPLAYTLDVAVLQDGRTVIMEVHNFIACGLYGFADSLIPLMLTAGVRYELRQMS